MKIRYKVIEHERVEDAPFMGCLISAIDCKFNCRNCFNQSLKSLKTIEDETENVINKVKSNPFNKGIILAGLEWTLQLNEAISLAKEAHNNNLLVMLYTGDALFNRRYAHYFDYIKLGLYKEELKTINHIEYGVTLASSNQHIYKKGVDY